MLSFSEELLQTAEISKDFKKSKHVQDIGLLEIFVIPVTIVLFVGDIGSDWYLASSYLHIANVQTRNYLETTRDRIFSKPNFNNSHVFFKNFCQTVSEKHEENNLFFVLPGFTYDPVYQRSLEAIHNDTNSFYSFFTNMYNNDKELFLKLIHLLGLEKVTEFLKGFKIPSLDNKNKDTDRFYYNYLCFLLSQNNQNLYRNVSDLFITSIRNISNIPSTNDCKMTEKIKKDYNGYYFHESVCLKIGLEPALVDLLIYKTTFYTYFELREVYFGRKTINFKQDIFSNKKILHKELNKILKKKSIDFNLLYYLHKYVYSGKDYEVSGDEPFQKAIKDSYEKHQWYGIYGALSAAVVLTATAASYTLTLW